MAIQDDPQASAVTVSSYTPGTVAFTAMSNVCVESGDRIIWVSTSYRTPDPVPGRNDLRPDGGHYLPHFAYRPAYSRLQDPDDPVASVTNPLESVGGNAGPTPCIRVDLGPLYCPWAGTVSIEGGDGPGDPLGTLIIAWIWDRARRQRLRWWETFAAILFSGVHGKPLEPVRMPRVPTNQRGFAYHTLTFYNVPAGTRIPRPVAARDVWTPDPHTLALDTGPGTFTVNAISTFGTPIPLGPFTFVTPIAPTNVLIFGIVF